jgi:hypothetical protein
MAAKRASSKKKVLSPNEALSRLGNMVTRALEQSGADARTGRCVYPTSNGQHCAVITEDWCNELHGTWTEGEGCP